MKTALITGISGQDGFYMAKLLLEKGYKVIGTSRNAEIALRSIPNSIASKIELFDWDVDQKLVLGQLIHTYRPSEIYNFAAVTSGEKMYESPDEIGLINGLAVVKILNLIKEIDPQIRLCQASSSEMFGRPLSSPQNENTPFQPQSPYAASKLYAHQMIGIYRERYGIFACSAILYNHESPLRGFNFVSRKITHAAAMIKLGLAKQLVLGNLDIERDWMFAGDAVNAMFMVLQKEAASDYIISGGISRSVRTFCQIAFDCLEMNYEDYVVSSPEFFRPIDSINLLGNPNKLEGIGWTPSISFEGLVKKMVDYDLALIRQSHFKTNKN
jgi:GDPmannose 4,6-dehydratase